MTAAGDGCSVGDSGGISRPTRRVIAAMAVLAQVALLFVYGFAPALIAGPLWTYAFLAAWIIEPLVTLVLAQRRPLAGPAGLHVPRCARPHVRRAVLWVDTVIQLRGSGRPREEMA